MPRTDPLLLVNAMRGQFITGFAGRSFVVALRDALPDIRRCVEGGCIRRRDPCLCHTSLRVPHRAVPRLLKTGTMSPPLIMNSGGCVFLRVVLKAAPSAIAKPQAKRHDLLPTQRLEAPLCQTLHSPIAACLLITGHRRMLRMRFATAALPKATIALTAVERRCFATGLARSNRALAASTLSSSNFSSDTSFSIRYSFKGHALTRHPKPSGHDWPNSLTSSKNARESRPTSF